MGKRVILDVDVGTDDYLAILLFLHAEKIGKVKIEAIICTNGNASTANVATNVVRLLEVTQRTDIPVYRGSSSPLIPSRTKITQHHGDDGFGGIKHESQPDLTVIKQEPAAQAICDIVQQNPNEISLICLAPLTNIALATRLYDDFASNVKDVWMMGGNHKATGNVTASAEFNFYVDPEAANIVLGSIKKPIMILTWETCLLAKIPMEWRREVLGARTDERIQLLNKAEFSLNSAKEFWIPCDAFLACAYIYPYRFIKEKTKFHATVELHGFDTRGLMVLDHLKTNEENVTVIEKINEEIFKVVVKNET